MCDNKSDSDSVFIYIFKELKHSTVSVSKAQQTKLQLEVLCWILIQQQSYNVGRWKEEEVC